MCDEKIQELISGHLDGCNTPEQEAILHKHLITCPACNQKMKDYQKIQEVMGTLEKKVPASFSSDVVDAIAKDDLPKPKPLKKLPFRYGTAIAAVAAALVLVIGSGKFGLPSIGTAAIHSQSPRADRPEVEAVQEETTTHKTLESAMIAASEVTDNVLPANVDCQALAQAQGCIVGVLYGETPEELAEADYLALSGGRQYAISQEQLLELSQSFSAMQLYYPNFEPTDAQATAYLIIAQ